VELTPVADPQSGFNGQQTIRSRQKKAAYRRDSSSDNHNQDYDSVAIEQAMDGVGIDDDAPPTREEIKRRRQVWGRTYLDKYKVWRTKMERLFVDFFPLTELLIRLLLLLLLLLFLFVCLFCLFVCFFLFLSFSFLLFFFFGFFVRFFIDLFIYLFYLFIYLFFFILFFLNFFILFFDSLFLL
jgi:hypothetical protein